MARFLAIIAIISLFQIKVYAQSSWQHEVDSIKLLLAEEKEDSNKIDLFNQLSATILSNDPEKSYENAIKAHKLAEQLNDTSRIIRSILQECDFFTQMGEYNISLESAYQALDLAKSNKYLQSLCHNRIANIYSYLKSFDQSLYHHRKSLYLNTKIIDSADLAIDYCNIGNCFSQLGIYDSALYYLRRSNNYILAHTGKPDPYSLSHMGRTFLKLENTDSALYCIQLAYKYDSLDGLRYEMAWDEHDLAKIYLTRKNLYLAKAFAIKSLNGAKAINTYEISLLNCEILSTIFQKEGNFEKALEYCQMMNSLKDTLRNNSRQSLILGLETKYRLQEQETILAAKEAKNQLLERQRTLFIVLSLVSVLFFISMVILVFQILGRQRATREIMHELKQANDSKERLISIIGHDLRGSIGSLRNAAKAISGNATDLEEVKELLYSFYPVADSTYDLLENLLTWTKYNKERLILSIDLIDVKAIVEKSLMHTKHLADSKSIEIISEIEPTLIKADKNMLLSVVRNLISNAIKFSHQRGEILIRSYTKDGFLIFSVEDQGLGMPPETLSKVFESPYEFHTSGTMGERGSGLGLSICKTFIQKHGGKIWAESDEGRGSTFYFSLPLN